MRRDITITAEPRETRGKNEARRLRVRGLAPAVMYGTGGDPVSCCQPQRSIRHSEEQLRPQHDLQHQSERAAYASDGG